jgi:hypothetical protein
MITKEKFSKLIESYHNHSEYLNTLYDLGIDLANTPLCNISWRWFEDLVQCYLTEQGWEFFCDWLYEDVRGVTIDGIDYAVTTSDELYDMLKANNELVYNEKPIDFKGL